MQLSCNVGFDPDRTRAGHIGNFEIALNAYL
jgi:hypothetical protein